MRGVVRTLPLISLALAALTACGHGHPRQAPTPAPVPQTAVAPSGATAPDTSPSVAKSLPSSGGATDSDGIATPEVTGEALKIFGDTMGVPGPEATAAREANSEPTWDIDVRSFETHKRVEYFIDRFAHASRERFLQELARSGRYEPLIRRKLRAAGMPEDLTYLALIESGYNPHAYSSAAAVGIWQFMTGTARGTGLRVDWWVDERRDPVRSTDGAIKFLGWLKDQFGSYYLAAAAYNGGPGRVERGLKRYADELEGQSGDSAFFALAEKDYLRAETGDYVPKLIAAALVAKDPGRYGLQPTYLPEMVYDSVRVPASTPLAAVAKASQSTVAEIQDLNPHVLRGVTPPGTAFIVRVPLGRSEGFDSAFAALPAAVRTAYTTTTVKKGETMASLARRTDVSAKALGWYNRELKPNKRGRLPVGRAVLVPSPAVVAAALDVPDPAVERYGSSSRGRAVTHVVRRGESLGSIAVKYHTTVAALKRMNGLRKSVIYPGQIIVVRPGSKRRHR